jgi:uncharacterized membrane protein
VRLIVKDRSSGEIVERVAIEETTAGNRLTDELKTIADLMSKQLAEKYPVDRYEIIFEDHPAPAFHMAASSRSLLVVNISAAVIGALLLAVLLVFRLLFAWPVFLVLLSILAAYLAVDYLVWQARGIRWVMIDGEGMTIFRGRQNRKIRILNSQITGVDVFSKTGRRVVNILTGGRAEKLMPGVTVFSGSRIRLTDDAFSDREFSEFIEIVKGIARSHEGKNT